MKDLKASSGSALSWTDVGQSPYGSTYQPVMALANNHIHFLDVPNVAAGSADIFVIHCECVLNSIGSSSLTLRSGQSPSSNLRPNRTHFLMGTCLLPMVKLLHSSNRALYVIVLYLQTCTKHDLMQIYNSGSTRVRFHP